MDPAKVPNDSATPSSALVAVVVPLRPPRRTRAGDTLLEAERLWRRCATAETAWSAAALVVVVVVVVVLEAYRVVVDAHARRDVDADDVIVVAALMTVGWCVCGCRRKEIGGVC